MSTGGIDGGAAEAAKQLEAYFMRQVLSTMPKGAMFGGDGAAASTLHGMFTEALADAIADGGEVGLARELESAIEGSKPRETPLPESDPVALADQISSARVRAVTTSIESTEDGAGQ